MLKRIPLKTAKTMRYIIMARWWNGIDWDITAKEVDTKDKVVGAISHLMKNISPYQISITDREKDHK